VTSEKAKYPSRDDGRWNIQYLSYALYS